MVAETSVCTHIPAGTNPDAVIAALHDHESYIRITCPQLISYHHVSGSPGPGSACTYEVTDKRPIGQTTFRLTLTDMADGIGAVVDGKGPTGGALHIRSTWRVQADKLTESVAIDANMLLKKMIKGSVEKSHPDQHRGFLAVAVAA